MTTGCFALKKKSCRLRKRDLFSQYKLCKDRIVVIFNTKNVKIARNIPVRKIFRLMDDQANP